MIIGQRRVWIVLILAVVTSTTGNPVILKYLEQGDVDSAYKLLSESFSASERNPDPQKVQQPLSQRKILRGGGFSYTSAYKLEADLEQAKYLSEILQSTDPQKAAYFSKTVIPIYERVLARIPPIDQLEKTHGLYQFQEEDIKDGILYVYNKNLHLPTVDEFDTDGSTIPIFSDSFDAAKIEKEWSQKGIVVIDELLSLEALSRIRRVMEESTVWYQTKLPKKIGGYTGAYIDDGLYQRILLVLLTELRKRLPGILKDHPMKYLWAYKYDSNFQGIGLHADEAAVNVNIWLTPEDANLDKGSGGLVVFTAKPPQDWELNQYNRDTDAAYETLLKPTNFANVTVPYRENRAVMFDSALFHHTDNFRFKKGYRNRRINLTILYGDMKRPEKAQDGGEKAEL